MTKFANLFDAGVELGSHLKEFHIKQHGPDFTLVPIMPNGVPVALGIESAIGTCDLVALDVERSDNGVEVVGFMADFASQGSTVFVVDDGVETGTAAKACGLWLREQGVQTLGLVVPVCPKSAEYSLRGIFDVIISAQAPLGTRALSWHFEDFDVIDVDAATALLATRTEHLTE